MKIPDPLHPAIVHFPIALIILGAFVAVAAAFSSHMFMTRISSVIWALAAAGAIAAAWSGEQDEDAAERAGSAAESALEEHEEWGERARNASILAALTAGAAVITLKRLPKLSRIAAAMTAVVSLAASWCVVEAGHYGGRLVYEYGVGVNRNAPNESKKTTRHE